MLSGAESHHHQHCYCVRAALLLAQILVGTGRRAGGAPVACVGLARKCARSLRLCLDFGTPFRLLTTWRLATARQGLKLPPSHPSRLPLQLVGSRIASFFPLRSIFSAGLRIARGSCVPPAEESSIPRPTLLLRRVPRFRRRARRRIIDRSPDPRRGSRGRGEAGPVKPEKRESYYYNQGEATGGNAERSEAKQSKQNKPTLQGRACNV